MEDLWVKFYKTKVKNITLLLNSHFWSMWNMIPFMWCIKYGIMTEYCKFPVIKSWYIDVIKWKRSAVTWKNILCLFTCNYHFLICMVAVITSNELEKCSASSKSQPQGDSNSGPPTLKTNTITNEQTNWCQAILRFYLYECRPVHWTRTLPLLRE